MDAKGLRELANHLYEECDGGYIQEARQAVLAYASLLASAEGDSDEIVSRISGRCENYPDTECEATGGCQCRDLSNTVAHILALKAELASVKAERDALKRVHDDIMQAVGECGSYKP